MKIREGFVSNSSSASFVIDKAKLNVLQLLAIRDHIQVAEKLGIEYCDSGDAWDVREDDTTITLDTIMDNFDMEEFLRKIDAMDAVIESDHS